MLFTAIIFYALLTYFLVKRITIIRSSLADIINALQQGNPCDAKFSLRQQLLWYDGRMVVPNNSSIRKWFLHEYYATKLGGHAISLRTYAGMVPNFYWKGMCSDIANFVRTCMIC